MPFIAESLVNHITICNSSNNMIQQALKPVNKRCLLTHINMIQHNQTALKRRVGGIYDPHQACLIILINFLKGDDQPAMEQTTYQNSGMIVVLHKY
jgi:hypothetical protein